jgi:hypothetical protein
MPNTFVVNFRSKFESRGREEANPQISAGARPMNMNRGVFRLWMVASVCWAIYMTLRFILHCDYFPTKGPGLWCDFGYPTGLTTEPYSVVVASYFLPPATAYVGALAIAWVFKGFSFHSN